MFIDAQNAIDAECLLIRKFYRCRMFIDIESSIDAEYFIDAQSSIDAVKLATKYKRLNFMSW